MNIFTGLKPVLFLSIKDSFDAICQNNTKRCEFIGCKRDYFTILFNPSLRQNDGLTCNHIEFLYNQRLQTFDKVLVCKKMFIYPTQQGGNDSLMFTL